MHLEVMHVLPIGCTRSFHSNHAHPWGCVYPILQGPVSSWGSVNHACLSVLSVLLLAAEQVFIEVVMLSLMACNIVPLLKVLQVLLFEFLLVITFKFLYVLVKVVYNQLKIMRILQMYALPRALLRS